jgi:hypothetical protein
MWPRFINMLLGIWLTAAPDILQYDSPARMHDQIVGPLIITFAMIAMSESTRPVRWINVLLGNWLVIAPVIFDYSIGQAIHSQALGIGVALTALVKGSTVERFNGGWTTLWRSSG